MGGVFIRVSGIWVVSAPTAEIDRLNCGPSAGYTVVSLVIASHIELGVKGPPERIDAAFEVLQN
jgi:hypothetical protein